METRTPVLNLSATAWVGLKRGLPNRNNIRKALDANLALYAAILDGGVIQL